jgi:hypothetical protein
VTLAVALVRPAAEAVTVAVPAVAGLKLTLAIPLTALTVDAGLNDPETPDTENVTALVAVVTVFPLAS